jgi:hypothetical protein
MSYGDLRIPNRVAFQRSLPPQATFQSPFTDPVRSVHSPYTIPTKSMPPPIASGWGAFTKPVKPVEFLPEKGLTDRYMELSSKDPSHKKLARDHLRYAQFMRKYISDDKPYEGIPNAVIVKKKDGQFSLEAPGRSSVVDLQTQKTAKMLHYKLFDLGLQSNENGYYSCPKTGTVIRLVLDPDKKEICACFYGLKQGDPETRAKIKGRNVFAAMREFFGGVPEAATQAAAVGKAIKEVATEQGFTGVMIGHSHGGGLAQAAALPNDLKGVVFNSRPMGAGVRRLYRDKLSTSADKITAFSGKGDWLGGNRVMNSLSRFLERIGITAPRTIGQGYNLPEAPGGKHRNAISRLNYQHSKFFEQLKVIAGDDQEVF